jgi:inhibitor of KinA sporulation pathway (predicted exonuclease)
MHFIILDLELTCWSGHAMDRQQEIIEIGAYRVSGYGEWVDKFHAYVKPLTHPRLSTYCVELTGIPQARIDAAKHFPDAYERMVDWLEDVDTSQVFCTWGAKDIPALVSECRRFRLEPDVFSPAINLKEQFARFHRLGKPAGLVKALEMTGLEFEGDHHRALDDAYNTALLFLRHLDRWAY